MPMVIFLKQKGYSLLKNRNGNVSLLHIATSNNNIKMMEFFIQNGLDINQESEDLGSPLEWAIAYG
jgi:ankyrin repeat protein